MEQQEIQTLRALMEYEAARTEPPESFPHLPDIPAPEKSKQKSEILRSSRLSTQSSASHREPELPFLDLVLAHPATAAVALRVLSLQRRAAGREQRHRRLGLLLLLSPATRRGRRR